MKILITGGAGFIGFHLSLNLLKQGYSIISVDNLNEYYDINLKKDRIKILNNKFSKQKQFQFKKIDITNSVKLNSLGKFKFDIVINLAAQAGVRYSIENPKAYINSNLVGFFNVLEFGSSPVIFFPSEDGSRII